MKTICSISEGAKITHCVDGMPKSTPIESLTGQDISVYDFFGGLTEVKVAASYVEEKRAIIGTISGEVSLFGSSHTILSRKLSEFTWRRRSLAEIDTPKEIFMVKLPQKKLLPPDDFFDMFDMDDEGMFLAPDKGSQMLNIMRKAAWLGMTVKRKKAELKIHLDQGRPACYASKVITGVFEREFDNTFNALAASGVIHPYNHETFDDAALERYRKSVVICEGNNITNDVPIIGLQWLEKTGKVYHICDNKAATPIETDWFCT